MMNFTVHLTVEAEGIQPPESWGALLGTLEVREPNRNPRGRWKDGQTWRATYALDVRGETVGRAVRVGVDAISRAIDGTDDPEWDLNTVAYVSKARPVFHPGPE